MIVSWPLSTVDTLPETGASRNAAPDPVTHGATARTVPGAIVLISSATASAGTRPEIASYTFSTAASSARLLMTTSAAATASIAVAASEAPIR